MEIITNRKALHDAITGLSRNKVDQKIQNLLVSAFYHRMLSGDNTFISAVLNAMPNGSRVSAARQYVEEYMYVKVGRNKDKKFTCKNTENLHDTVDDDYLGAVAAVNWYEFKAPKAEDEYDSKALIEKVRKQVNKAVKVAAENGDDQTAQRLADLIASLS